MIAGFATPSGTSGFASRQESALPSNYRLTHGLTLSNVGMGTYLGEADSQTDSMVADAVKNSISAGINVIDTAINYRAQKAERSVGRAISELIQEGNLSRDEIFISTKNGYVTNDADVPLEFWPYIHQEYVKNGVVSEGDITSGYHCMTVKYLEDQLDRSLKNLGLETIDLMYIHNAIEGQLRDVSRDDLLQKLKDAFEFYEQQRKQGKVRFYGMATWESFRVPKDNLQFFSLNDMLDIAKSVGGDDHGFRFIQLPFNMYYDQALLVKNHTIHNTSMSCLEAASALKVGVFSSVPFMQGRLLAPGVMPEFGDLDAPLRALQFIRSAPSIVAPLVGQKSPEHTTQNLKIMTTEPLSESEFGTLVKTLTS